MEQDSRQGHLLFHAERKPLQPFSTSRIQIEKFAEVLNPISGLFSFQVVEPSKEGEILDMGLQMGLVEKSGSWLSYGGEKIAQGRENAKQFLLDNPDTMAELETKVREQLASVSGPGSI